MLVFVFELLEMFKSGIGEYLSDIWNKYDCFYFFSLFMMIVKMLAFREASKEAIQQITNST